jgi:23S rRNA (adenine2503-C2)-methyltransferase
VTAKVDLFGMTADEISAAVAPYGLEKYRGRQIAAWLYQRQARDFAVMTDLPKGRGRPWRRISLSGRWS